MRARSSTVALLVTTVALVTVQGAAGADRTSRLVRIITDSPTGDATTSYVRVDSPRSPAPTARASSTHRLYVAKVTNQGAYVESDDVIKAVIDTALDRWEVESEGVISTFSRVDFQSFDAAADCTNGPALWNEAGAEEFPAIDFDAPGNHLMVIAPKGCAFGVGTIGTGLSDGGRVTLSWDPDYTRQLLMHELGHNVGLEHARARFCEPACTDDTYGNHYSFMGASVFGQEPASLDSAERLRLQIAQPCEVPSLALKLGQRTVTASYDLFGRGTTAGTRGLRLTDPSDGATYVLDWRNRTGRDADGYYGSPLASQQDRAYVVGVTVEKRDSDGSGTLLQSFPKPNGDDGVAMALAAGGSFSTSGMQVRVDATSVSTSPSATSQVTVTLKDPTVAAPPKLPAQAGSASVAGPPAVGATVRAAPRAWTAGACFRYQWRADGVAIPGARSATFMIPTSMQHKKLSVRMVGQRTGYRARTVTSSDVVVGRFTAAPKPRIEGRAAVGSTLRAMHGKWQPKPTAWAYRWFADGHRISAASTSSLHLTRAMRGKQVHVVVVASRDGFDTTRRRSAKTADVQ